MTPPAPSNLGFPLEAPSKNKELQSNFVHQLLKISEFFRICHLRELGFLKYEPPRVGLSGQRRSLVQVFSLEVKGSRCKCLKPLERRALVHKAFAEEETLVGERVKFSNIPLFLAVHYFQQIYLGRVTHALEKSNFLIKDPW